MSNTNFGGRGTSFVGLPNSYFDPNKVEAREKEEKKKEANQRKRENNEKQRKKDHDRKKLINKENILSKLNPIENSVGNYHFIPQHKYRYYSRTLSVSLPLKFNGIITYLGIFNNDLIFLEENGEILSFDINILKLFPNDYKFDEIKNNVSSENKNQYRCYGNSCNLNFKVQTKPLEAISIKKQNESLLNKENESSNENNSIKLKAKYIYSNFFATYNLLKNEGNLVELNKLEKNILSDKSINNEIKKYNIQNIPEIKEKFKKYLLNEFTKRGRTPNLSAKINVKLLNTNEKRKNYLIKKISNKIEAHTNEILQKFIFNENKTSARNNFNSFNQNERENPLVNNISVEKKKLIRQIGLRIHPNKFIQYKFEGDNKEIYNSLPLEIRKEIDEKLSKNLTKRFQSLTRYSQSRMALPS
jgi:hypothetical protein